MLLSWKSLLLRSCISFVPLPRFSASSLIKVSKEKILFEGATEKRGLLLGKLG